MRFNKKSKIALGKEPRQLAEIHQRYSEVTQRAGALQYQVLVLKDELLNLNSELRDLNYEAAKRAEIDKAASEPKAE